MLDNIIPIISKTVISTANGTQPNCAKRQEVTAAVMRAE